MITSTLKTYFLSGKEIAITFSGHNLTCGFACDLQCRHLFVLDIMHPDDLSDLGMILRYSTYYFLFFEYSVHHQRQPKPTNKNPRPAKKIPIELSVLATATGISSPPK